MPGRKKPTARQAFNDNLADAEALVAVVQALENRRVRRMRRELRERLGSALGLPQKHWENLDCIESDDLFAIFKPGGRVNRDSLSEQSLRPLLRQALVAACAAVETFVGDRVMERLRGALDSEPRPTRLLDLPMTVEDWLWIEESYERRRWGLREVVEAEVRKRASPAPSQIGVVFGIVGERGLWKRVDKRRGVRAGASEEALDRIYERRNRIAHQGDRLGHGRATISIDEVVSDLRCIASIVERVSD
ncbi:MAG: HEPN domain-containing protein [Candidatus Limnocylindria bacterium]